MKVKALKAACLAVGLATAWGMQADAQVSQIQLTITPSNNLSHVYFLYGTGVTSLVVSTVQALPNLVAGVSTTLTLSVNTTTEFPAYAVIGLYDETNKLLTLGLPTYEATNVVGKKDFNTEFSPDTEDAVASSLLSNDTTAVMNFFHGPPYFYFLDIGISETGELVNFSSGTDGGSVTAVVAVPEPSPALLAGIGALAILAFHGRRLQKAPLEVNGKGSTREC
jgi:hypothetical protein